MRRLALWMGIVATMGACEDREAPSPAASVAPPRTSSAAPSSAPTTAEVEVAANREERKADDDAPPEEKASSPEEAKETSDGPQGDPPTRQAWKAVSDTLPIEGGAGLICEAKTSRGWLRVHCRKPQRAARPTTVEVKRGVAAQTFTRNEERGLALVCPAMAGVHVEAFMNWTTDRRKLVIDWPRAETDAKKPTIVVGNEPDF